MSIGSSLFDIAGRLSACFLDLAAKRLNCIFQSFRLQNSVTEAADKPFLEPVFPD